MLGLEPTTKGGELLIVEILFLKIPGPMLNRVLVVCQGALSCDDCSYVFVSIFFPVTVETDLTCMIFLLFIA